MERWSENVKKLENSCKEKINAMNISNKDKPIAEFLCVTYGKQEKKLPTTEEIDKIISDQTLIRKVKGGQIIVDPFNSVIPMWIVNWDELKNFDTTDQKFKLGKVFFDTGGRFFMVDKQVCENIGLKYHVKDKEIDTRLLEDEKGKLHPYTDLVDGALAALCVETDDKEGEKIKCDAPYYIQCLKNLGDKYSLSSYGNEISKYDDKGEEIKRYDDEKRQFMGAKYNAYIGNSLYSLLREEPIQITRTSPLLSYYGIIKPLTMIFSPYRNIIKPKVIERRKVKIVEDVEEGK